MAKAPGWKEKMKKKSREWLAKNTYGLKEGENTFRILPNPDGVYVNENADADDDKANMPMRLYRAHPQVGKKLKRFVTCGKDFDTEEGDCWLCDEKIPELEASKKEKLRDKADEIRAVNQAVFQVAWVDDDKLKGPKAWFLTIAKKKLGNRLITFLSGPTPYDDPVKGRNLMIERTGQGMSTQYGSVQAEDEPSKVPSSILAKLKSFDEIVAEYSEERQKAVYYGREEEEELEPEDDEEESGSGDDEEEESPKKKGKKHADEDEEESSGDEEKEEKPKSKKKPKDDDDEESGDEEEEEEEEEKPKGKKKKSDDEDDESSDEDESSDDEEEDGKESDDEEEEEKPKGKKKPKDDDDEEESSDDEEEETPKNKGKKKSDDEEEEEDEAPLKKKGKKKPADDDDDE